MHFTEEVQIPTVSPTGLQKIASVSPEFKAVLPKIETHCVFVALLGELHWPVRVVVHHLSEILHGLWPHPLAVQGANCLGLPVVDGSTEICHRIFSASPPSFFVGHAFCKAPVGLPFLTWRLTESVEFLLGHATLGELRVIVNLWQDKDATPFEVRAVGQRPARKGIKSRGFVERELELLLLGDCTVAKPNQTVGKGKEILHIVLRHVDLGHHLVSLPQTHVVDKNDVVVRRAVLVQLTDQLAHFLSSWAGMCLSGPWVRQDPKCPASGHVAVHESSAWEILATAARARRERQVDGDSGT